MKRRIAVIGAGISGLACALRVQANDPATEVRVYEQENRVGGKIRTEHHEGFVIEHGPDAFLSSKAGGVQLAAGLSMSDEMISPIPENRRSYILSNGSLLPIPQGLSGLVPGDLKAMLRSPLISLRGRARMAAEYATPIRKSTDDESIQDFMVRRYGTETWERMIEPLLTGIYGGDGTRLSLDATFPHLRTQERIHGSLLKAAMATRREAAKRKTSLPKAGFISFRGGMSALTERAATTVADQGGVVSLGTTCVSIAAAETEHQFVVTLRDATGEWAEVFDGIALALPAWVAADLLSQVSPSASADFGAIEHGSSALISLGFPASQLTRPLDGYGYVVPRVEGRDATAMTWTSRKWRDRSPDGHVLLRVFAGRVGREQVLEGDDTALVALALREASDTLGLNISPSFTRVQRWMRAMPQYTMGHLDRVNRIQAALAQLPGVEVAGTMFRGVGIPDSITSGETAADNLIADLDARIAHQAAGKDELRDAVLAARAYSQR